MTTNALERSGVEDGKKPISSFALSTNDHHGILITHTQLKGPNYEEWAKAIRMSLRVKTKKGFIDDAIKEPAEDSDEIEDWDTAKELWDDIQQRFSVCNGACVHQLKTEVSNCKQNGDILMGYYARIKKIWDDLTDYDQMLKCTCEGCLNTKLEKRSEEERVHQFLMGLDELPYSTVRSNIIAMDPLPNMYRVYSRVTEQKQVKTMTKGVPERSDPMSFAIKTGGMQFAGGDLKDKRVRVLIATEPQTGT